MRKIGLDVGDKTVGIAVSDPLGMTAQGIMTLERVGIRKDTGKILDLVKEYYNSLKKIDLRHIKGHAGHKYNEIADKLATGKVSPKDIIEEV